MKEVYYNAMRGQQREYLDANKPLPRDFQQVIFDQVKPQIDRINNEFVQMSEIKSVPKGTIPFLVQQEKSNLFLKNILNGLLRMGEGEYGSTIVGSIQKSTQGQPNPPQSASTITSDTEKPEGMKPDWGNFPESFYLSRRTRSNSR